MLYGDGAHMEQSQHHVEAPPDVEDLQRLATNPDDFLGLRRIVVRNVKPFRFSVPYEQLFPEAFQAPAQADDVTREEMREINESILLQEGWPAHKLAAALDDERDIDEARQYLIERLDDPDEPAAASDDGAPDSGAQQPGDDDDDVMDDADVVMDEDTPAQPVPAAAPPIAAPAQAVDGGHEDDDENDWVIDDVVMDLDALAAAPPLDDAATARALAQADREAQAAAVKEARDLARTHAILDHLRILLAARDPPVELLCSCEGREPDEAD